MNRAIIVVFLIAGCTSSAFSGNADLFSYDREKVGLELNPLQLLEDYVSSHEGISLCDLKTGHDPLVNMLNIDSGSFIGLESGADGGAFRIPSFLWGCCLGPLGVIAVYLMADDSDETKKSFMGCVTWGMAISAYYIIWTLSFY